MKKLFLVFTCLLAVAVLNAQSLEQIVKNHTVANKLDKISNFQTLKLTGSMSMMGMEMPVEIWMKSPNKIKSVTNFNGTDIIQAYDGEKGYMINPMMGSTDPVEMNPEQTKQLADNNKFKNMMEEYLKNGQIVLEGEEAVNGSPAYKIKATVDNNVIYYFIDKTSNLVVKVSMTVDQQGQSITVDSYPSDYTETDGVLLPMKTTTSAAGNEFVQKFTKVEVNIPMEDSIFKLK